MDVHTKAQRSYNMSQVKSKNTKPELLMFSKLEDAGCKFEKHYPIYGKPDIVFTECMVAVFVDGEFWHGKNFSEVKKTLTPFWLKKIDGNIKRDRKVARVLRKEGWHVMRLWDKQIVRHPERSLSRIMRFVERVRNSD